VLIEGSAKTDDALRWRAGSNRGWVSIWMALEMRLAMFIGEGDRGAGGDVGHSEYLRRVKCCPLIQYIVEVDT
jgi:hypothetical protein